MPVTTAGWKPWTLAELDSKLSYYLYKEVGLHISRVCYMLLEHTGNGLVWLLLVPLAWMTPQLSESQRCCLLNLFFGLWVDLALVGALKGLVRRARPVYNHVGDFVVVVAVDHYSFPSGHSSRVAFVAAFATVTLADKYIILCFLATLWALTVAMSRALMGRHYTGDVIAGIILGIVTTAIVTKGMFAPGIFWLDTGLSERLHWRTTEWIRAAYTTVTR